MPTMPLGALDVFTSRVAFSKPVAKRASTNVSRFVSKRKLKPSAVSSPCASSVTGIQFVTPRDITELVRTTARVVADLPSDLAFPGDVKLPGGGHSLSNTNESRPAA